MMASRILQNNLLLWVDANINENEKDTKNILEQWKTIVHHIDLFTQIDDCLRFLNEVNEEKALVITSGSLGQHLVEHIHHLPQVDAIYIFCGNPDRHQVWTSQWPKIKGIHNQIKSLCESLQVAVKQTNEDLIPISFVTSNEGEQEESTGDLNRLEPSFMYTTLYKRILLSMEHEPDEKQSIVDFCRVHYAGNLPQLRTVEEFNQDYRSDKAIWWYTRECFTYQMLNRALRLLESDIIIHMGFFIHDLHHQLDQLHHEQFSDYHDSPLTLYRGQALSIEHFAKLQKSRGRLLAFNSFLSTSKMKPVSLAFAVKSSKYDDMVGVLFVMTVDPTIRSATFADIKEHSYFATENEILFSMHTVFRVEELVEFDNQKRLFEVRLTLTSEDDPELRLVTDQIGKDISGETGWKQLGRVLLEVGPLSKAEEFYLVLLEKAANERDQGVYYNQLGLIKDRQGDCKAAVKYHKRAISIWKKIPFPPTDASLSISHNNIGLVYSSMEMNSKALTNYKKALTFQQKTFPENHPAIALSYNNIGGIYRDKKKYTQALSYYNKSLAIREEILPANHPDIAQSFNNIGGTYNEMAEHTQALSYFNKALDIWEKTLPPDHPDIYRSFLNIAGVYSRIEEHTQARSYYKKALTILEKTVPADHPDLVFSLRDIGVQYYKLKEYSEAKSYFQKVLDIQIHSLRRGLPDKQDTKKWLEHLDELLQK